MTKTTTPKAPRMTKAEKLAKIELETLAIETQIATEKAQGSTWRSEAVASRFESDEENIEIIDGVRIVMELDACEIDPNFDDLYVPLPKKIKQVKTVKTGVGQEILMLIAQGELSNKEIVAMVCAADPLRKTTYACVAWYKSQVKAGKIDLPEVEVEGEESEESDSEE